MLKKQSRPKPAERRESSAFGHQTLPDIGSDIMLKINYMSTLFVGIDVSSKSNAVYAMDFEAYIGLAVIGCGLWVDNEHIGLVRHKHFAGGKKICDMDAVNRCRLQADDDCIKVFMVLHAASDHAGKFISSRLVIAK